MKKLKFFPVYAILSMIVSPVLAATQTFSEVNSGNNSWNDSSNWVNAIPTGTDDAIISSGDTARATGTTVSYSGTLTLESDATLRVDGGGSQNAFTGASSITMAANSTLANNSGVNLNVPNIILTGDDATFETPFGASDHNSSTFGTITGAFDFRFLGFNNHTYQLDGTNTFTSLQADPTDRYNIRGNAVGAFGTGDVTVPQRGDQISPNRSARLYFDVQDTFADTATLHLEGPVGGGGFAGDGINWVVVEAGVNEVLAGVNLYGVALAPGTYNGNDSATDWIGGDGSITIASTTAPHPGDANDDGIVDVTDLGILATNWQLSGKTFAEGNFDETGLVDVTDLGILATHWQHSGPPWPDLSASVAAVPEPATMALLGLGALGLLARRRRS